MSGSGFYGYNPADYKPDYDFFADAAEKAGAAVSLVGDYVQQVRQAKNTHGSSEKLVEESKKYFERINRDKGFRDEFLKKHTIWGDDLDGDKKLLDAAKHYGLVGKDVNDFGVDPETGKDNLKTQVAQKYMESYLPKLDSRDRRGRSIDDVAVEIAKKPTVINEQIEKGIADGMFERTPDGKVVYTNKITSVNPDAIPGDEIIMSNASAPDLGKEKASQKVRSARSGEDFFNEYGQAMQSLFEPVLKDVNGNLIEKNAQFLYLVSDANINYDDGQFHEKYKFEGVDQLKKEYYSTQKVDEFTKKVKQSVKPVEIKGRNSVYLMTPTFELGMSPLEMNTMATTDKIDGDRRVVATQAEVSQKYTGAVKQKTMEVAVDLSTAFAREYLTKYAIQDGMFVGGYLNTTVADELQHALMEKSGVPSQVQTLMEPYLSQIPETERKQVMDTIKDDFKTAVETTIALYRPVNYAPDGGSGGSGGSDKYKETYNILQEDSDATIKRLTDKISRNTDLLKSATGKEKVPLPEGMTVASIQAENKLLEEQVKMEGVLRQQMSKSLFTERVAMVNRGIAPSDETISYGQSEAAEDSQQREISLGLSDTMKNTLQTTFAKDPDRALSALGSETGSTMVWYAPMGGREAGVAVKMGPDGLPLTNTQGVPLTYSFKSPESAPADLKREAGSNTPGSRAFNNVGKQMTSEELEKSRKTTDVEKQDASRLAEGFDSFLKENASNAEYQLYKKPDGSTDLTKLYNIYLTSKGYDTTTGNELRHKYPQVFDNTGAFDKFKSLNDRPAYDASQYTGADKATPSRQFNYNE